MKGIESFIYVFFLMYLFVLINERDYLQRENQNLRWSMQNLERRRAESEKHWTIAAAVVGIAVVGGAAFAAGQYRKATRTILHLKDQAALAHRTSKADVENAKRFGVQRLATSLIDVADNLNRATESVKDQDGESEPSECSKCAFTEGVKMTEVQFLDSLKEHGIELINPGKNDRFDPSVHEAVAVNQQEGVLPGNIIQVMQPGWSLNKDRILRPARVVVANQKFINLGSKKE
mmetsp:Transcript_27359/g.33404  ORF Transcript_27359/g.33404 Transcript_27359/m.33404 type:complete len:233 (+) Transcript_27359:369-1067(+)